MWTLPPASVGCEHLLARVLCKYLQESISAVGAAASIELLFITFFTSTLDLSAALPGVCGAECVCLQAECTYYSFIHKQLLCFPSLLHPQARSPVHLTISRCVFTHIYLKTSTETHTQPFPHDTLSWFQAGSSFTNTIINLQVKLCACYH